MKPDWKDAPEWAQWRTYDEFGHWEWHELKPTLVLEGEDAGLWYSTGRISKCHQYFVVCESRP